MRFRNWLEMSFDMSNVHDPFDSELHAAMSGRKALVYHGTSTKWFWPIVKNGFTFDPERANWDKVTPGAYFTFDIGRTNYYSYRAVTTHGGERLVFVAEVPFGMLGRDPDDKDTFDKNTNLQAFSPVTVPAKYITGVLFPVSDPMPPETPIRRFIAKVNRGKVPGIEPEEMGKAKFARATPDDVEWAVAMMLQDLIQYTNLSHWVTDGHWLFNQKVVAALARMQWMDYSGWKGPQWLQFLERVLGEKVDPDYYDHIEQEYNKPTYQMIRRFQDPESFRQYRLGKKK